MITWKELTTQEQLSLMSFDHTPRQDANEEITNAKTKLFLKGILQKTSNDNYSFYSLTPIGYEVLNQAFADDEAQAAEDTATAATAATAGEREADTVHVYPGIDKQGYDILSGGRLDTWRYEKGDAFEYALVLANDNIRALQAELATARKQVAELTGAVKVAIRDIDAKSPLDALSALYRLKSESKL